MLSDYRNDERVQPLQGVTAHVADVQAEGELVHVAMQMLLRNLMVDAIDSALEHSPNAFDAVRADSVLGVVSGSVVDGLVSKSFLIRSTWYSFSFALLLLLPAWLMALCSCFRFRPCK
jgi:hypothetical protein